MSLSSLDFHTPYVYQGPCSFNITEVESRAGKPALPRRSDVADCNGKEKDWESGSHLPRRGFEHLGGKYCAVKNYGARYYWSEILTSWLSVDPMMDKYPNISPYAYCAWNPVKLVDPDGREVEANPYFLFNGTTHKFEIWDDNNTPEDYSDDLILSRHNGGNNVSLKDNPMGNWEDGIYPMVDIKGPRKHYDKQGNPVTEVRHGKTIPVDSKDGAYGEYGIFCAQNFNQDDGQLREGMGIHSGRSVTEQSVVSSFTRGCVRVTPETMEDAIEAIQIFGPLTNTIIQNNRPSSKSSKANAIHPGGGMPQFILKTVEIKPEQQ